MKEARGSEIGGIKALGRKEFQKHQAGGRLTPRQMLKAKCFDCMGGFIDGKMDCGIKTCPLYPLMAYREKK